jgi:ATP adenylyltransferase/5',5'''-P-1,P-4-tetraphosphate phosphorylase II
MNLQKQVDELIASQRDDWKEFNEALHQLDQVKVKTFYWGKEVSVNVQYNPGRIVSTAANIDKQNILVRPCFLCETNRPKEQRGISFLDKYTILANPFPILKNHLTIPIHSHVPQRIRKKTGDMLTLAEALPDYIVFYNGPKCGASAPDHFHLQAGLKSPVLLQGENELRSCLIIESSTKQEAEERFEDVYYYLRSRQPEEDEPMLNIITYVDQGNFVLHIFPRKAHRPRQYYLEGNSRLMVSPGALDMAGLIIVPREEDFEKIKQEDIEDIYSQVSMPII